MTVFNGPHTMVPFNEARVNPHQRDSLSMLDSFLGRGNVRIEVSDVDGEKNVTAMSIRRSSGAPVLPNNFASLFPQVQCVKLEKFINLVDLSPLAGLEKLKGLWLRELSRLRSLPFVSSFSLKKLVVNQCEQFDYGCLGHLEDLKQLYVMDYISEHVPSDIFLLSNLKKLSIYFRHVARIPHEIGNLQHLKYLRICGRRIASIPQSICNLELLETLILRCGSVTKLPGDEIGQLVEIKHIELCYCRELTMVQPSLLKLPRLEKLALTPYRNLSIPEEHILDCTNSLVEFVQKDDAAEADADSMDFFKLFHYMARVNRAGRCLLRCKETRLALWAAVLGRCSHDADSLLFLLKQKQAELVPKSSGKRKASALKD